MEFKLLGWLRILGRGAHFDDVAEILGCGRTTVNNIFKLFVNYSEAFYAVHVYVSEGEELDQVGADYYGKMDFPGCVGLWILRILCGRSSILRLCGMFVMDVIIVQA